MNSRSLALAVLCAGIALATPTHAAEPREVRLVVAGRSSLVNAALGGVSIGLQAGVRVREVVQVGVLGEWGGLKGPIDDSATTCKGDASRSDCLGRFSTVLAYGAFHPVKSSLFDPYIDLVGGLVLREVYEGSTRTDATVGAGAGLDLRFAPAFVGLGANALWIPTFDGRKDHALLITLRVGAEF